MERGTRAKRIMPVRRSGKDKAEEPGVEHVLRIGQVLRDLLLDGSPFLFPEPFGIQDVTHADGLDIKRDFKIACRNREVVLSDRLLSVGIKAAAHGGDKVRKLSRRKTRATAKHHVLQRMRHARKTLRRFVR